MILPFMGVTALTVNMVLLLLLKTKKQKCKQNHYHIISLLIRFNVASSVLLIFVSSTFQKFSSDFTASLQNSFMTAITHLPMGFFLCLVFERFCHVTYTFEIFPRSRINCFLGFYVFAIVILAFFVPFLPRQLCCFSPSPDDDEDHSFYGNHNVCITGCHCFREVFEVAVPLTILTGLYIKTMKTLNPRENMRSPNTISIIRNMRIIGDCKILKNLITLVITYVIFTQPNNIYLIFNALDNRRAVSFNLPYAVILPFAMYLSVSPLIYIHANQRLLRDTTELLKCFFISRLLEQLYFNAKKLLRQSAPRKEKKKSGKTCSTQDV